MLQTFEVAQYDHLSFTVNWSADSTSDFVARALPGHRQYVGDIMHFYDTIQFNPYYLRHASKEKIIEAIIHESIHAYIDWCILSYQNQENGIDSNYLRTHFPIHWEYIANYNFVSNYQHDLIVNNYVDEIVNAIFQHGNQSAPAELRNYLARCLAYTGLRKTSVWPTLSDTCEMGGVSWWAEHFNYPNNWVYTPQGCSTSYSSTLRDSLQMLGPCQ